MQIPDKDISEINESLDSLAVEFNSFKQFAPQYAPIFDSYLAVVEAIKEKLKGVGS